MKQMMTKSLDKFKSGLRWAWGHKLRVAVLGLVLAVVAPRPAKSQFLDPCCAILSLGLGTISSTLSSVIGGGLNNISSIDQGIQNFEQTTVWPQSLITQAQTLVGNIQGISSQIQSVIHTSVASATLPAPQQLEQNLLSADSTQISQTGAAYTAVYGSVPDATAAPSDVRNRIDMTDAAAQAAMKRAIEIDQLADLEIQAANQINQSIQSAAPGSAPIIEAQADAWLVRANAYTQTATADLMRVRAIDLANAGADVKTGATNTSNLGQQIINLLKRQ
ncbi:MAG: hypothetical protein ACYDA9_20190 [Terriglobia bacterium]